MRCFFFLLDGWFLIECVLSLFWTPNMHAWSGRSSRSASAWAGQSVSGSVGIECGATVAVFAAGIASSSASTYASASASADHCKYTIGSGSTISSAHLQGYPKDGRRGFAVLSYGSGYANVSGLQSKSPASWSQWTYAICATKSFASICPKGKWSDVIFRTPQSLFWKKVNTFSWWMMRSWCAGQQKIISRVHEKDRF